MNTNNKEQTSAYPENWREIDQPFFNFVQDLLAGKGAANFVELATLSPDLDFWGKNPPEEIVLATGSTRKAFMAGVVLNNINIPLNHPMDFQDFMVKTIYNGDGSLKEKTFLGEFHGVPVFAESAAEGETAGNNPKTEAVNKAYWLSDQSQYDGRQVLVASTDTVDYLDRDGNGKITPGEEGLGKPMNHEDYPKKNSLMNSKFEFIRRFGQQIFAWQEREFIKQYTQENFISGLDLVHTNAIALLNILENGEDEVVRLWEVILKSSVDEEFFSRYQAVVDQGGGGASQQNQHWENVEEVFTSLDDETKASLQLIKDQDPEFFKFLVIFQISGMPIMNILREIELFAEQQRTKILPKEVVVFNAQES